MKQKEAQLNIETYKSRKVFSRTTSISYWHCQNVLVCAMAEVFGMRNGKKFWYALAHVILVCSSAFDQHFYIE